jgi:hypothetical protein
MALIVKDRVLESSTSTSTGSFTLTGAQTGYQSFSAIGNGNTTYYTIQGKNPDGTLTGEWEVGTGTWSTGNTLARDTVLSNSLGTSGVSAQINFSAGTKDVFCTYPSDKAILGDTSAVSSTGTGNVVLSNSPTLTTPVISTITNTGTITLPTSTDTLLGRATTDTLTNKRITPRVITTTSSATPTINTDNTDQFGLTAQAVDVTSFTTNLSGTPTDGQKLWIYIVGTAARAIAWGASFESSTATLPTTTVTTNRLDVGFVWNAATSKWRCVAVA